MFRQSLQVETRTKVSCLPIQAFHLIKCWLSHEMKKIIVLLVSTWADHH